MPETIDSAGTPELKELPALHTTPSMGEGSRTPPDPNKLGPGTIPGAKSTKPSGAAGAPPLGGAGGGGLPGVKPPTGAVPQKSPEEQLNEEAITTLKRDINKIIKTTKDVNDLDSLIENLLDSGWSPDRIQDLIDFRNVEDVESLFVDVTSGTAEKEIEKEKEIGAIPPSLGKLPSLPVLETETGSSKKPDNDITGVNPPKESNDLTMKRSELMSKKIRINDGTLEAVEASDVSQVIDGISSSRRRVASLLNSYDEAVIRKAGLEALADKEAPIDISSDLGGIGGKDLDSIVSKLKDAIQELVDWLDKGKDLQKDESIPSNDFSNLEDEIGKGEKSLGDLKDKGPFAKKEDKKDEKAEKEDKTEKKEDEPVAIASDEETIKEAKEKGSGEAMDVAMGKKGPKGDKKKVKDDKKAQQEEMPQEEQKEEQAIDENKEVSASGILEKIQQRLAEMKKEANLYPFKDLNKQQVDNINAQTAKDQASEIDSEIKQQPAKDKLDPTIHPDKLDSKLKAQKGKVSVEVAERIRQHSIENAVNKAKLSVELAAQQQLKGIIDNPLREAFVKNMIESGLEKEAAEAIAYNAFIDGYEDSQKLIMKEAFETFMEKDVQDFVKVAKFVKEYSIKEGSQDPVEEEKEKSASEESSEETRAKTASSNAPLRGTQVQKDRKEEYRTYWEAVARERRGY